MQSFSREPQPRDSSTDPALSSAQQNLRLQALIQDLYDMDPTVRSRAALALGSIGADARDAVPALAITLKDTDPCVREHAAYALGRIGPEARDAVPALVIALADTNPRVHMKVAWAVDQIGTGAREEIPILVAALKDSEASIRYRAAYGLGSIGPEARYAVSALVIALADTNPIVRMNAVWALGEIGSEARDAVQALAGALQSIDPGIRLYAAMALGKIGPPARDAVQDLTVSAQRDSDESVRSRAEWAVGNISGAHKEQLPKAATEDVEPLACEVVSECAQPPGAHATVGAHQHVDRDGPPSTIAQFTTGGMLFGGACGMILVPTLAGAATGLGVGAVWGALLGLAYYRRCEKDGRA